MDKEDVCVIHSTHTMEYYSAKKGINFCPSQYHGWTLRVLVEPSILNFVRYIWALCVLQTQCVFKGTAQKIANGL